MLAIENINPSLRKTIEDARDSMNQAITGVVAIVEARVSSLSSPSND